MLLSRYKPKARVGKGGMGEVLRADDLELRREVAYKRIHARHANRDSVVERFLQEARITARLDHPNIVPVYALDEQPGGPPAYSMKLVHGMTLEQLLTEAIRQSRAKKPLGDDLDLNARLEVFLKVCDAIHYAHSKGVIHRDLKPANIMIGEYHDVYVMDWGLAKDITLSVPDDLATLEQTGAHMVQTQAGRIVGTPEYMSPEQAWGLNDDLDGRSDQFALGLMLREIISLHPAIRLPDPTHVVAAIRDAKLPAWKAPPDGSTVPPALVAVCQKALSAERDERYPDVDAMAADIRRYMQGEPTSVLPDTLFRAAGRALANHREAAVIVLLLLFLGVGVVAVSGLGAVWAQRTWAREREQRLAVVLSHVSHQAAATDAELLRFEGLLQGLGDGAVALLEHGTPDDRPVYFDSDYNDDATPPTLIRAKGHKRPVSFDHVVIRPAPGVDVAANRAMAERAVLSSTLFRRVFLASRGMDALEMGREVGTATLIERGSPVVGAYFGLEEGMHVSYPGHGGYDELYDPRLRPWYKLGRTGRGPRWGSPHQDQGGQGLLLVCATPLYSESEAFLGVAGIEITFDTVVSALMSGSSVRGAETTWLVDDQARVVVRSDQPSAPLAQTPPPFPIPAVASAMGQGHGGHLVAGGTLYAWAPLETIGWWLVVSGDADTVEAQ